MYIYMYLGGVSHNAKQAKSIADTTHNNALNALKTLDILFTQLAASLDIHVLPGDSDPSNFTLPQQPLHHCLLPSAATYSSFAPLSNPARTSFGGLKFRGSAGQNVEDMLRSTQGLSRLEVGY